MDYRDVTWARRGGAGWITLNRPDQLNALSDRMLGEIDHALGVAEQDAGVHCIVFTGAGRAFCAGADLKFVNEMPHELRAAATGRFLARASALMSRVEAASKPVIAAVNGVATAGGMELVLCCDIIVAADTARLGDGHANYGLLPGAGGSARLPRRIGMSHAKYLFFTGDLVPVANRMFDRLVNEIVASDDLDAAVERIVARIASKSPLGLRRMKELANRSPDVGLATALESELAVNAGYVESHDRAEGLAAFAERRPPRFEGR